MNKKRIHTSMISSGVLKNLMDRSLMLKQRNRAFDLSLFSLRNIRCFSLPVCAKLVAIEYPIEVNFSSSTENNASVSKHLSSTRKEEKNLYHNLSHATVFFRV